MMQEESGLEWRSILERGWAKAEAAQDSAATLAATVDEQEGADDDDPKDAMEVSTSDDASSLLVAVKERLTQTGQAPKYHDFLTAISDPTGSEDALKILAGHDDLIAAFEKCFAPAVAPVSSTLEIMEMDDGSTERRGPAARASQLVNLVFANKSNRPNERAKMLDYVKTRAEQPAFPKRLFILRGTAGAGGAEWAMQSLRKEVDIRGSILAAQLAHVCCTDDFFTSFAAGAQTKYVFDPRKLAANNVANEARVRLAMEAGLEPLYVANPFMQIWEMRPYVLLADRLGYTVTVVAPDEINSAWNDLEFLLSRSEEKLKKDALQKMLGKFEMLPSGGDPRPQIRAAEKPKEDSLADAASKTLPASAMLYKLEKLMLEGTDVVRVMPLKGKGWGVNGELDGEVHSFKDQVTMCTYDNGAEWRSEDQDVWTFEGLTWLEDLRLQAFQLPESNLPMTIARAAPPAPKTPPTQESSENTEAKAAPAAGSEEAVQPARKVPLSRAERFKQRAVRQSVEEEPAKKQAASDEHAKEQDEENDAGTPAPPPAKRPRKAATLAPVDADAYEPPKGMPTEQEEMSAATFLAAVKARLTDWGKVEQYHEFVVALSGSVDAKAAVRILRGHDDLLSVFRRKFAPNADLLQIKAEIDEDGGSAPRAPAGPPPGHGTSVKQELGRPGVGVKQELSAAGKHMGVKKELGKGVKTEMKAEDMPHPPSYRPDAPRGIVSVGDDSDEDEVMDDVSISLAVKKGRDECIAHLAKCIFRKERASREGVRQRFDMVRYATRRAAKPRFPRELYLVRGPPGMGKTDYAVQLLNEHVDVEPGEELGARLTHICATDDFYETFKGDNPEYKFDASKLDTQQLRNQARVRLAMEAGIHPLIIDEPNLRLFEMKPYVALADRLGYVVTIVEPSEICGKWDDIEFLTSANDTVERQDTGKVVQRDLLQAMLDVFEPLPAQKDEAVRASKQGDAPTVVEADGPRPSKRAAAGPGPSNKGPQKIAPHKGLKQERPRQW